MVQKEATPYLYRSAYARLRDREPYVEASWLDGGKIYPKVDLSLIQNLAIELDVRKFHQLDTCFTNSSLVLGSSREAQGNVNPLPRASASLTPVLPSKLMAPFAYEGGMGVKRKTCNITLTDVRAAYNQKVDWAVFRVLARLGFEDLFVALRMGSSPLILSYDDFEGRYLGLMYTKLRNALYDKLGPAIWHAEGEGYIAFHPGMRPHPGYSLPWRLGK